MERPRYKQQQQQQQLNGGGDDAADHSHARVAVKTHGNDGGTHSLALDELLLFMDQVDDADLAPPPPLMSPTPTSCLSAATEKAESALERCSLELVPTSECEYGERPPTGLGSERVVEALVLSSSERAELLSALESESEDSDRETHADLESTPEVLRAAETGESVVHLDSDASSSTATSNGGADPRDKPEPSKQQTASAQLGQQDPQQKAKKPRRRKRQKDEMNYLEYRIRHLEAELERLRWQERAFTEETLVVASRFNLVPKCDLLAASRPDQWLSAMLGSSISRSELWERIAQLEKEETRTVVLENMRLRAQYESQLQVVKRLESLYHDQLSFAVMDASPERGFLSKRARMDTFSDDAIIFASLGCDFDAQYAQTDTILESCGLTHFEGSMQREMQLKRDERGTFCLENISSKVAPFDVHTIDRVFWHCATNEQLQHHHGMYEIRNITNDSVFTKSVDPLHLPNGADPTTVTVWVAMKRYVEEHRVVAVCEIVVEMAGSISMRLREKTWVVLRSAWSPHLLQHGLVSLVQSYVRMTPEIGGSISAHDLAVGTLTNLVMGSYNHHKQLMHQVAESLLISQFANLTV